MKLESIKYSELSSESNEWRLDEVTLGTNNLIVGKNATGKSKTLAVINDLAKLLRGDIKPTNFFSGDFDFEAKFIDEVENKKYEYLLTIKQNSISKEIFIVNGNKWLERTENGTGKIWANWVLM